MAFQCNTPAIPTVQEDNDTFRVTRWDFQPGAVTGWHHRHGWPYFVVMLMDGTLKIHDGKAVTDVPLVAGQSYMRQSGVRTVMNGSSHPIAFIEIEVKRPEALGQ